MRSFRFPAAAVISLLFMSLAQAQTTHSPLEKDFVAGGTVKMDLESGQYDIRAGSDNRIHIRWNEADRGVRYTPSRPRRRTGSGLLTERGRSLRTHHRGHPERQHPGEPGHRQMRRQQAIQMHGTLGRMRERQPDEAADHHEFRREYGAEQQRR